MKVQWATASSRGSSFPKQRPPLKGEAGPSLPIASRPPVGPRRWEEMGVPNVAAEFNFQRMIEKTDRMCTELLHSRGAE
jgi:hypothetical protein